MPGAFRHAGGKVENGMRIDQLLPNFSYGDAIGNHTLALRDTLRKWGFESEIFTHLAHHRLAPESRFFEKYEGIDDPGNVLIYHYSIGSVLTGYFSSLKCRKVMIYHNITPAEFFRGVNRRAERECARGRRDLGLLAGEVELALGDSEYNRLELEELGYAATGVLPIFIPFEDYGRPPDRRVMKSFGDGRPNILHVGRFVPNKKIENLIKVFYFLRRMQPESRLVLVGTDVNMENYSRALRELIDDLKLQGVVFTGHVTFPELLAFYRTASLYLTMSEHEGFCVPLIEAMITGVPVVAYASTAIPGTLGPGGLLAYDRDFPMIAEMVNAVLTDEGLRRALVQSGKDRLMYFGRDNREELLSSHLRALGIEVEVPLE